MKSLREYILDAKKRKIAIGHFNFSNIEGLYAIARAAKTLDVPVIVGTSEGEQEAIGAKQAVSLVKIIREDWGVAIFLNADHHYSFTTVKGAIDAGYDSVIFDGSKLSFEENIEMSKKCVQYAHQVKQDTERDILVEVELGFIGEGSNIKDAIPEGISFFTKSDEARKFIVATGADMLAPAVGNFHGMLRHGDKPRLNIDCIKDLSRNITAPLVLHGGSGEDRDFEAAIDAGIVVVHVSTELRRTYTNALKEYIKTYPDEITPSKYGMNAALAMEKVVLEKLKVFNRIK